MQIHCYFVKGLFDHPLVGLSEKPEKQLATPDELESPDSAVVSALFVMEQVTRMMEARMPNSDTTFAAEPRHE